MVDRKLAILLLLLGLFPVSTYVVGTTVPITARAHEVQTICNSTISDFNHNGTAINFNVTVKIVPLASAESASPPP